MPSHRIPSVNRRLLALALLAPLAALASGLTGDETINTFAGTGVLTSTGDGGPAAAATLSVYHLQVGRVGDLYFADTVGHRVRRIDAAGIISTVAGNGAPGDSGDNRSASPLTARATFTSSTATAAASARWPRRRASSPPSRATAPTASAATAGLRPTPSCAGPTASPWRPTARSTSPTARTTASAKWTRPATSAPSPATACRPRAAARATAAPRCRPRSLCPWTSRSTRQAGFSSSTRCRSACGASTRRESSRPMRAAAR